MERAAAAALHKRLGHDTKDALARFGKLEHEHKCLGPSLLYPSLLTVVRASAGRGSRLCVDRPARQRGATVQIETTPYVDFTFRILAGMAEVLRREGVMQDIASECADPGWSCLNGSFK